MRAHSLHVVDARVETAEAGESHRTRCGIDGRHVVPVVHENRAAETIATGRCSASLGRTFQIDWRYMKCLTSVQVRK
jgi:hypothetical protein